MFKVANALFVFLYNPPVVLSTERRLSDLIVDQTHSLRVCVSVSASVCPCVFGCAYLCFACMCVCQVLSVDQHLRVPVCGRVSSVCVRVCVCVSV